jgi:hypothetical protein
MGNEDWKKEMLEASEAAKKKADAAADSQLAAVMQQADELKETFDALKLNDQATYDKLVAIVEEATATNESMASLVSRVKSLGGTAVGLAGTIGGIASGGGLAGGAGALLALLKK